ncbi:MAG: hypothetical protein PSV16_00670 [Flavobacterium sp.]|nr:hypothetical protein [Flavobacterium sp.]
MKKNIYYTTTFQRKNPLVEWFTGLFKAFASPSRLLLEGFIRKDFGERYFNLYSVLSLAISLAILPVLFLKIPEWIGGSGLGADPMGISDLGGTTPTYAGSSLTSLFPRYLGWYFFLVAFIGVGVKHHLDMLRNPSVYDFEKFSLCSGTINPLFYKIKIPGIKTDVRLIECLLEPLFFFTIGFVLWFLGQTLGNLIMFCSFCYAMSYIWAYKHGDDFIMDTIDQIIVNQELENSFVNDVSPEDAKGFQSRGKKPEDKEMRRQILNAMIQEEEIIVAK